jgi:hypothetical protein
MSEARWSDSTSDAGSEPRGGVECKMISGRLIAVFQLKWRRVD